MTRPSRRDWTRVRAIIRATLGDTPVDGLEETLVERLRIEFDERDPSRFPAPDERAKDAAARRLKAMGL